MNNYLDELVRDLTSVAYPMAKSEVRARIESLLADAKREGAREVIEDIPGVIFDAHGGADTVQLKQQLRSKYLTPTGNLDQ